MSEIESRNAAISVPSLGYDEFRVLVWLVEPGDRVYAGDRLLELSASGVVCDVAAPANGILIHRSVIAGDMVRPGQMVGSMTIDSE